MTSLPPKSYQSIAVALTAAFATLSGITLLISGGLGTFFSFQTQQNLLVVQQQLIARDAADIVHAFLQEKVSVLSTVADTTDPLAAPPTQQQLILDRLIGTEPGFRHIVLVGNSGDIVARTSRFSHITALEMPDPVRSGMFREILQNRTYLSSVYISEETSEPFMIVAVPATDALGDVRGALFAELNLKFLWDLVGGIRVGEGGLAYVVDRDGYLVAFGDVTRVLQREQLTNLQGVQRFRADTDGADFGGALTATGIAGTTVVTSYAPLGTPDWAVFVEVPFNEAYAPSIRLFAQIIMISLGVFGLSVFLARAFASRLTQPIGHLQRAVRAVGEGRLDTEIVVTSNDEIGALGIAFSEMLADLKKSRESLLAKIEELEKLNKVMIGRELRMVELKEEAKKQD